ncbi:phosphate ABC transporter permease PstA [Saccharomonospora sp. NPDC006951]
MPTQATSSSSEPDLYTPLNGTPLTAGQLPRHGPKLTLLFVVLAAVGLWLLGWNAAACAILGAFSYTLIVYTWSRMIEGSRKATDRLVTALVTCAFLLALLPLISVVVTVVANGLARFDTEFFTHSMRGAIGEGGGAHHAIMGTLIITGLATVISVPIGMLTAIYLVEYGRGRLAKAITFFVDVMTGIPSIVAGLFAYALFALFFGPGVRMGIMGAVALSVLMIPVVVRSTEEMLKLVPNELREASYALAVPKWRTILKVVLPTALAGIATGVTLAIARVIGETAPLLVTVGITASDNFDPFDGRMATLSVFSYNSYAHPGFPAFAFTDRAWAAALVLIIIVMVLNLIARLISRLFAPKTR